MNTEQTSKNIFTYIELSADLLYNQPQLGSLYLKTFMYMVHVGIKKRLKGFQQECVSYYTFCTTG